MPGFLDGLGTRDEPGPVQRAFAEEHVAPCRHCTADMVMRVQALLEKNPKPSDPEIRRHMMPHLYGCGNHARILRSVRGAARTKCALPNSAR